MIRKKNGIKRNANEDRNTSSVNNTIQKENKDVDQLINALIKENDVLTKAFKNNAYTPEKVLNNLLKVLYIQRNQLNSLEEGI